MSGTRAHGARHLPDGWGALVKGTPEACRKEMMAGEAMAMEDCRWLL